MAVSSRPALGNSHTERLDRMDWQEEWSLYGAFCRFMGRIFIEIGTVWR